MGAKIKTTAAALALLAGLAGGWAFVGSNALAGGVSATTGGAAAQGSAGGNAKGRGRAAVATWFGPGMYGTRTACGQVLTRSLVGVASRRLPCGTLVKLGYRGRTLVAPVVDRGPYTPGVRWDLTAGAAHALHLAGTARVHARIVGRAANGPLLGAPAAGPGEPGEAPTAGGGAATNV